jgi:hypothetical protein
LSADEIDKLFHEPPDLEAIILEEGSKAWPLQTRGRAEYRAPQDAATTPRGKAAYSRPVARPVATKTDPLESEGA